MNNKIFALPLVFIIITSGCVPIVAPSETLPAPVIEESTPIPAPTEVAPEPELPVVTSWKAIRDQRYGFGLAVPCWWLVTPVPSEGYGGVMTLKNYDEAYFNANSTKGFWDWPNGTLKIDMVIMEDADPSKSDADAYMQFTDPTMTGVVAVDTQQIGINSVTVVTLANLNNENDPHIKNYIYRLAPDKILLVAPYPQAITDTPDFQAMLGSIVLTQHQSIALPTLTPAPALINASCAG